MAWSSDRRPVGRSDLSYESSWALRHQRSSIRPGPGILRGQAGRPETGAAPWAAGCRLPTGQCVSGGGSCFKPLRRGDVCYSSYLLTNTYPYRTCSQGLLWCPSDCL